LKKFVRKSGKETTEEKTRFITLQRTKEVNFISRDKILAIETVE
jgi:hypothetical protein